MALAVVVGLSVVLNATYPFQALWRNCVHFEAVASIVNRLGRVRVKGMESASSRKLLIRRMTGRLCRSVLNFGLTGRLAPASRAPQALKGPAGDEFAKNSGDVFFGGVRRCSISFIQKMFLFCWSLW